MTTKSVLVCASLLALVTAAPPAFAEPPAGEKDVPRGASRPRSVKDDCETRMRQLDASSAEGQQRLDEKNDVIDVCANQHKRNKTIERLVAECAKYEEQPVVKQQLVAECRLAAFNYANALRTLKVEYGK